MPDMKSAVLRTKESQKYCSSLSCIGKLYLIKEEGVKDKNAIKNHKEACLPSCKLKITMSHL